MTDEQITAWWDKAVEESFQEFTRAEPMSLAPAPDRLTFIRRRFADAVEAHVREQIRAGLCERQAWSHGGDMGPELNATRCAAAIREGK